MKKRVMVIVGIFLVSCSKTVDVELSFHEPRLVLHGYIATGETFKIAIGKSAMANSVMDGADTYVDNAWALLYENDLFRDSLRYDAQQKRYITQNVVAVPGKPIELQPAPRDSRP